MSEGLSWNACHDERQGEMIKQLKRIADALEQLVEQGRILKDSKAIANILKAEDQQLITPISGSAETPKFTKETLAVDVEINIEHKDRLYKKFIPCKYKCGGLASWPTDWKEGDQKLHIHPIDYEVLGFAVEDMSGKFKCPTVVKK